MLIRGSFHFSFSFVSLCLCVRLLFELNFWFGFFASYAHVCRSQFFFTMYAELHAKTNFSFLEGASHPDELVGRAAELGYRALAVTDRNSLAGIVRTWAAKDAGLKLIVARRSRPRMRRRSCSGPPIGPPTAGWLG